jgi:hypothetical protein
MGLPHAIAQLAEDMASAVCSRILNVYDCLT